MTDAVLPAAGGVVGARHLVHKRLVIWHFVCACACLLVAATAGLAMSLQFLGLYPFEGIPLLAYGRVRMLHTNLIAYGFLANGFLAGLYYVVPRVTGRPVASDGLGWLLLGLWQAAIAAGAIGQLLGFAQGVEWGETPTGFRPGSLDLVFVPVDLLVAIGAVLAAVQFLLPIARSLHARMYVAMWYVAVGLVWLILTYLMGNTLPEWVLAGSSGAATAGLFIHDLVGLFVTPLGWGLVYFFVPVILRVPIWSHALSVIGFWALAFFYPLNGVHHFLLSSIPMSVQYGAVISTIAVSVVVATVIVNFAATLRGRGHALRGNLPIRWLYTGMLFYFTTCVQCAFQVTLTVQEVIHFTDWVPGHAHLVMLGVFAFWIFGILTWLWPRLVGHDWYDRRLNHWHYWLSTLGVLLMFLDLLVAGLVHGFMLQALSPWMDIVDAMKPFWAVRTLAGAMLLLGQVLFVWNLWRTARGHRPYDHRVDLVAGEAV